MTRVLLAHGSRLVADALRQVIELTDDVRVQDAVHGLAHALQALADRAPDVLVLDLSLLGARRLDRFALVRDASPELGVVCVGLEPHPALARRLVAQGASAYVLLDLAVEELVPAIRAAAAHPPHP